MRLQLYILAQAVEDVLRFELEDFCEDLEEDEYLDALTYILRYPKLRQRLASHDKRSWLGEIEDARN